jgi:hypothetical protein
MIKGARIEGFRGIQRLEVDGLGRVNLIIGKNDCGKTALMEALMIAGSSSDAPHRAHALEASRRAPEQSKETVRDFDRFWRPLFWNLDADAGFTIVLRNAEGAPRKIGFRKSAAPPAILTGDAASVVAIPVTWAIDVKSADGGESVQQIVGTAAGISLPPYSGRPLPFWIASLDHVGPAEISLFSNLKQASREEELLDVLREVDSRISGLEILAPGGTGVELFVRIEHLPQLLPLAAMGDGFKRCFQIGVSATAHLSPLLFIDEIDNGLHHSALGPVWRWLATVSKKRDLQVFATTHSEECIHAAADAFRELDDDGLRVIRLDRREDCTTAAIYDRDLVEATERMDMEIRG